MRENKLRRIWSQGGAVANGWMTIPNSFVTEVMANQGWDSITIDMQHGAIDYSDAIGMLTAISTTDAVPVVRVPWLDPGILMKVLDAGAYGVICPMINNAAETEKLVAATHYPPRGTRSFGPVRAAMYGGADYQAKANDTIVVFAMIETRDGLDNLEDILRVEGLEAIYVGPSDLSLALGCRPLLDELDKPAAEAVDYIVAKCKEHGVVAGIHNGSAEGARQRIEKGYQFVSVATEAALMASAAQQALAVLGKGPGAQAKEGY